MVPEARAQSRNGAFGKVSHLIHNKKRFGLKQYLFLYIYTYRINGPFCTRSVIKLYSY